MAHHTPGLRRIAIVAGCLVASVIAPAAAQIDVYFTQPVDTTLAISPSNRARHEPDISRVVTRLIDSARATIDMAMYNLSIPWIADALIDAHRRGVRVRVVAHVGSIASPASRFAQLGTAGIRLITNERVDSPAYQPLMHHKFFVIDATSRRQDAAPTVVTGSWNATFAQTFDDANNVVVIRDRAVAGAYLAEFEEMWGSSSGIPDSLAARFGSAKREDTDHVFTLPDGTRVDVYFSPSDEAESQIRRAISTAQGSIYTSSLTITSRVLAEQVIRQNGRGADARVLIENIDDEGTQFPVLVGALEAHSTASVSGQLHHKYAIVDAMPMGGGSDPLVVTGSHNWTYSANTINDENTLVIHSAAIANQYLQEFAARYREAGGTRAFDVAAVIDERALPLVLYPNPVGSVISLSRPLACDAQVMIVDPLGRIVMSEAIGIGSRTIALEIEGSAEGLHLLRVIECDGRARTIPLRMIR